MASVKICDRISTENVSRKELTGVKLDQDVKILKKQIASDLKIAENVFGKTNSLTMKTKKVYLNSDRTKLSI